MASEQDALRAAAEAVLDYLVNWIEAPGERGQHPHAEMLVTQLRAALAERGYHVTRSDK